MWPELFIVAVVFIFKGQCSEGQCIDIHSHSVSQGLHYIPGPNSCTVCICDKGSPKLCKSVLCTQPTNCKSFQRGNTCCDFKCLDDILDGNSSYKDTYDLALPLFASVVFAVITLSLLFFVVHHFRRRKLHERHNRQISDDQRSLNSIGYIAGGLRYLPGNIEYLRSGNNDLEFHYEETNNHLSLWKPPGNYFPRGEAPPPYEEAVRSHQISNNLRNQEITSAIENIHVQHYISETQTVPQQSTVLVNNIQPTVSRPVRGEPSNTNLSDRCESTNRIEITNRSDEYQNWKAQDLQELIPLVEQTKTDVTHYIRPSKVGQNTNNQEKSTRHSRQDKSKKMLAFCEKVKCYGASDHNKSIGKNQTLEIKNDNNQTNLKSNLEKKNDYQDAVLNTLSQAIAKDKNTSRTLERLNKLTQKSLEENRYENVGISLQKLRHRSIPAPIEFQNEKKQDKSNRNKESFIETSNKKEKSTVNTSTSTSSRNSIEPKRAKEQIFLIDSKAAPFFFKDLKKSLEDCRDSACSLLRDPNDVPVFTVYRSKEILKDKNISLHRTLPKNLKQLATDCSEIDNNINCSSFKSSGYHSLHRSLPKQLNNYDAGLPLTITGKHCISAKNECPLLKPVDIHCSNSSSVAVACSSHNKNLTDIKHTGEQNSLSYQRLFFSQDDDDYRSECENCKTVDSAADEEENDIFNETMTLQRRPLESVEDLPYYRTSLTLPSQIKKPRPILQNPNRENWFRGIHETSSSEESE